MTDISSVSVYKETPDWAEAGSNFTSLHTYLHRSLLYKPVHCTVTVNVRVPKDIVKYSLVKSSVLPFMPKLVLWQPV
jgi:hypothetical protein